MEDTSVNTSSTLDSLGGEDVSQDSWGQSGLWRGSRPARHRPPATARGRPPGPPGGPGGERGHGRTPRAPNGDRHLRVGGFGPRSCDDRAAPAAGQRLPPHSAAPPVDPPVVRGRPGSRFGRAARRRSRCGNRRVRPPAGRESAVARGGHGPAGIAGSVRAPGGDPPASSRRRPRLPQRAERARPDVRRGAEAARVRRPRTGPDAVLV